MALRPRSSGFTLIELMVVILIVALLAGVALPSYRNSVLKANRAVAKAKLLDVAAREEVYFADNKTYIDGLDSLGLAAADMGVDQNSNWVDAADGNAIYVISARQTAAGMGFFATASTANRQTDDDANCATLTVTNTGVRDGTGILGADCWK